MKHQFQAYRDVLYNNVICYMNIDLRGPINFDVYVCINMHMLQLCVCEFVCLEFNTATDLDYSHFSCLLSPFIYKRLGNIASNHLRFTHKIFSLPI